MFKRPIKPQDKKIDYKDKNVKDTEDILRKIKNGLYSNRLDSIHFNKVKKNLLDRGDAKNPKVDDIRFKYASKNDRATEANAETIKAATNVASIVNKNGILKKTTEVQKANTNTNAITVEDAKYKPIVNSTTEKKERVDKKIEKEPQVQRILGRNDRTGKEKNKNCDQKSTKIKEVITIPYLPVEDSITELTEDDVTEQIKPILNTAPSKASSKSYKTVSFMDQRDNTRNVNVTSKRSARNKPLSPNFKTRTVRNKARVQNTSNASYRRKRKCFSPTHAKGITESPLTEVLKWEPSCLTSQTKPYYEAWVDTTLTALSTCSDEQKLLLEKDLIEAFRYLKRPVSPELVYEKFNDERYTGRIRIRYR